MDRRAIPHARALARRAGEALLVLLCLCAVLAHGAQEPQAPNQQVGPPAPAQEPAAAQTPPQQKMPRVAAVRVDGQKRYSAEQLIAALGQRVGEPVDALAIHSGIQRLWRSFRVRAEVDVVPVGETAEPGNDPGEVDVLLHVSEMPSDIEPRFVGNDAIDLETLRKWALLEERTELYLHQALRVRQRLLEGYRREGFYWAEVNVVTRGEDEASAALSDVIFEIREGPKVRVRSVEIHGNRSMPDTRAWLFFKDGLSHLAKRELKGPSLTNWWRGEPFVDEVLQADLLAMRQVYRDRGWLDAVVELERLEFNAERNRVTVHVRVDEGPRYVVRSLSIEGLDVVKGDEREELKPIDLLIPKEELLALCKLQAGQFFEQNTLNKDKEALRLAYGDRGHLDHPSLREKPFERGYSFEFLEPATVFDLDRREVDVIYRIVQGRPLKIREISFSGSSHTRDRVLRREVSVFPGEQADLREINKSLARIQGTGYFSDQMNQLEHREPFYKFSPVEGQPDEVDLEFQVEEGRVIDFQISGGIDSNEGAFGVISLTMRNFDLADTPRSFWSTFGEVYDKEAYHGAGQLLELELSPGTELSRYRLRFLEPDLFRQHLNPISLDVDLQKRIRAYETHDEDRTSYALKLGKKLTQDFSVAAGYAFAVVDVDDLDDPAVPPLLVQQNQQSPSVIAGPTFDLSLRNLDNYVAPRQGYSLRWENAFNDEAFGGDYDFVDSQVHWDGYHPIGTKGDGTKIVAHLGLDGGVGFPYSDTDDVPYTERFFLGGSRIMRGFQFRGIGPVDELSGRPLGGETFVTASGEIYYPLHSVTQPGTYERREMLRATLFTDWGVLDPDAFELDPTEVRGSVGFGFGLAFPIPLTLNFGFPVVSEDVDSTQVFSFSIALF